MNIQPDREANIGFVNELMATEISQRNARKEAQESTGRWIVLTIVALMTLLLTLSKEAGILNSETGWALRLCFIATLMAAAVTVACAGGVLWPRVYEKLGGAGLDRLNKADFLDQPTHEVTGQVVATQIGIAKKMDDLHEEKAKWLKRSFRGLAVTLTFVVAQGIILGVDPPASSHPDGGAKMPSDMAESIRTSAFSHSSQKIGGATAYRPLPTDPMTAMHALTAAEPRPIPPGTAYPPLPLVPDTRSPKK